MLYNFLVKIGDPQILGLLVTFVGTYHIASAVFISRYRDFYRIFYGDEDKKNGFTGGLSENLIVAAYKESRKVFMGFIVFSVGVLFQIIDFFATGFTTPVVVTVLLIVLSIALPPVIGLRLFTCDRMNKLHDHEMNNEI